MASPFNNDAIIKRLRSHLEKMPEKDRKKLAEEAMKIVGTNDPEKLKEMLKAKEPGLDPEALNDTLNKFLKGSH